MVARSITGAGMQLHVSTCTITATEVGPCKLLVAMIVTLVTLVLPALKEPQVMLP